MRGTSGAYHSDLVRNILNPGSKSVRVYKYISAGSWSQTSWCRSKVINLREFLLKRVKGLE